LFTIFLPVAEQKLVNLLFDGFKSFGLKLFELIFGLANICSFNLLVNFFSSRWGWHLSTAYLAMGVTDRIKHGAGPALPFHHEAFTFFLLFLFFLVLFLNLLDDFFFDKFSNVPSFDTDTKFIVFGENVEFGCENFPLVVADDLLYFGYKLTFINKIGYFLNEKKSFPLSRRLQFLSDFIALQMVIDTNDNILKVDHGINMNWKDLSFRIWQNFPEENGTHF
jgi:hypothetical protein